MDKKSSLLILTALFNKFESELARNNMVVPETSIAGVERGSEIFWMSILERFYLDYYYSVNGERTSFYLISIDLVSKHIESILGKELSRAKIRGIKSEFTQFIKRLESSGADIENRSYDKNGDVSVCYLKIKANRYIQVNKHLYDECIRHSNGDFRYLKTSISVFLVVMKSARRKIVSSKDDFEVTSSVFFAGFTYIGDYLNIDRRTISKHIHILAKINVISYIVLKKRGSYKELYFITDSMTENCLSQYVLEEYRSHQQQDVIRVSTSMGDYDTENESECTINFDSDKFVAAKEYFKKRAFT